MENAVSTSPSRPTHVEYSAARAFAAVSALWWSVLFFGIIDLTVPFDQDPRFLDNFLLETGWGLLYTFLVAAPLLALALRPVSQCR
jgi:hypothetical protein